MSVNKDAFQPVTAGQSFSLNQHRTAHLARRPRASQAMLLALIAAGFLWQNVLFFRFFGFAVTLPVFLTLLLFPVGLRDWFRKRRVHANLFYPPLALLAYELVVQGVFRGKVHNPEWITSFSLLAMCAGILIVSSKIRIDANQLPALARGVSWCAYLMGGLGVAQFALGNVIGIEWQPLPDWLALREVDTRIDALRFAGLRRAWGISGEYSFYGIGMALLAVLCLMLIYFTPPSNRKTRFFQGGASLMALMGLGASASFSGWALLAMTLLAWFVTGSRRILIRHRKILLLGFVALVFFVVITWPFLRSRWQSVLSGKDTSANYRLRASMDLILSPGRDVFSSLIGTGIGLEQESSQVLMTYEKHFGSDLIVWRGGAVIVNGWAYIAVTMGWIGLALNGWILVAILRNKGNRLVPRFPLLVLLVGLFFASGHYLMPYWWAWLVLVVALRSVRIPEGSHQWLRTS